MKTSKRNPYRIKSMRGCLLMLVTTCFCVSCATQHLWESTDYQEWIFIPSGQTTVAELESTGAKYEVVPAESRVDPQTGYHLVQRGGFLVEKSATRKLRDHARRAVATPVTVTFDTVAATSAFVYAVIWSSPELWYLVADRSNR